ncbi:MAG TPA: glycerophosphodiester phosphodiesterase [Casimicrobiaceae bacterium]|jgi:glycerophosphoryl diester phosphodiesterase
MAARLARVAALVAALPIAAHAFDLQGHRGARGLAPENTLAAFKRALEIGVTTLETDMGVTRDDVVVISHEPALYPPLVRLDGAWLMEPGPPIRTLTLAELRRYDIGRTDPATPYGKNFPEQQATDGQRFPTLDEVLALAKSAGVRVNIETKITPTSGTAVADPETFARLVVDRIAAAGMEKRATVQSFDWRTLAAVRRIHPAVETVCLTNEGGSFDTVAPRDGVPSPWFGGLKLDDHGGSVPALVAAAGCAAWSPNFQALTRERLADAKARKLRVVPWTVNQPADMARLVDWGVDGLITDYPDRARAVLAERGITPR